MSGTGISFKRTSIEPGGLVAGTESGHLPDIPATWSWALLGEIAEVVGGVTKDKKKQSDPSLSEVPYLRVANVQRGRLDLSNISTIRVSEQKVRQLALRPGDVLLNEGGDRDKLGRGWIWEGQIPDIIHQNHVFRARVHNNIIHPKLLSWYANSLSNWFEANGTQSVNLASISLSKIKRLPVPIPPLAEQSRIVDALEEYLSRLDAAAEAVVSAKRRLKPFTSSVLDRTVLGTWTATSQASGTERDDHRFLSGFSSKRFEYTALPSLPKGWFWRRASDVCDLISSGSTPKAHLMHAGGGDVPFLKVYNITQDGRIDFTNKPTYVDRETHENQLKRSRVRPGDVLTNIVGPPLGKTAVVPNRHPEWNINQAITAFRAGQEVQPEWLALILRSPVVLDMLKKTAKATAGQFNIALSTCRELPLPIPPMDVQLELVKQSAELLDISDRFASQVATISMRAKNLRQAVLRRAFTGELVPQDTADELASVLLDRIRAEGETEGDKPKRTPRTPRKTAASADASPSLSTPTVAVQQELPL